MNKKRICIDFDGVLHSYVSGWQGHENACDPPTPGAMAFLIEMIDRYELVVHSARSQYEMGLQVMWDYLREHLSEHFEAEIWRIWPDGEPRVIKAAADAKAADLVKRIEFVSRKPAAHLYIDDRGWRFDGNNWPTAQEIEAFVPWMERPRVAEPA